MKKFYVVFVIAVLSAILFSCSHRDADDQILIKQNSVECLDVSQYFDIEQIVQFDTTKVLGNIRKVYHTNDDILIWTSDGISRYDIDGKYVNTVGQKGRGPEEYAFLADVCTDGEIVVAYDLTGKFLLYSIDGEFIASYPVSYIVGNCRFFGGKLYVSTGYQNDVPKFHVYSIPSFDLITAFGEVSPGELNYRHYMFQNNFYVKGSELLYHISMCNDVLSLDEADSSVRYSFDFWGNSPSSSFWKGAFQNVMDVVTSLSEKGYVYGLSAFATDGKHHIMSYSAPDGYRVAYHDQKHGESFQSSKVKFGKYTDVIPFNQVVFNCNGTDDLSFIVPSQSIVGEEDSNDNPSMIIVRFR